MMTGIMFKLIPDWARRSIAQIIAIFLLLIAMGCAVNLRLGGQQISREVTGIFESYQVLPDHRYYHIGWDTRPYAIIGLKDPYHLNSKFWFEFDANPETLKKRVDALEIFIERGYNWAYGYYILDKAGERIGVWYSSISIFSASVDHTSNTVSITMDRPWVTGDRFDL
ncbi:MAG: hypothetical protein KJP23_01915 [Deltaproteobacteria bacterium]|nr:hypothetical protein [Deltaproteobacteria bacterium]